MGKAALAALFSFLLASAVFAAANDSEMPPAVPASPGVLFAKAIFPNGTAVQNLPLVMLVSSEGSQTVYHLITDSSGKVALSVGTGKFDIDALLADSSTSTIDHAATAQADTGKEENVTLIFYPAGSVAGVASTGGSPVGGAKVKVACPSSGFDYVRVNGGDTVKSGEAGDFLFKALPVGTCQVSASTGSLAGSAEAQVAYEKTISVTVEMKQKAAAQNDLLPLALAAIVIAIAIYSAFRLQQKGKTGKERPIHVEQNWQPHPPSYQPSSPAQKKKAAAQKEEEEDGMPSKLSDPKVRAVIATLGEREKEIVKFLFKAGGRAKRSQLQHKLLIPKTSLLRNLRSLERKKIVKLTPFGRNLLAEIDDWLNK